MWKETLLQLLVALLPVFAFQIWYDRPGRYRGISIFLGLLSCISMLLCLRFSENLGVSSLDIDFRFVPLILGCLYGGYAVAGALTATYIIARIFMIDALWETVIFSLFVLVILPIIFLSIPSFKNAVRQGKQRIATTLGGIISVFTVGAHITFLLVMKPALSAADEFYLLVNVLLIALELWASIFVIESVKEKQQLHHKLQRISIDYHNEVQKLQQFIDVAPLGVIVTDREGTITHINENAVRSISDKIISLHQLIGQSFTAIHPNIMDSVNGKLLLRALQGAETRSEIGQDNNKVYIKTGFSVRDLQNNDVIGAALIAHDITELTMLKDEIGRMDRFSLVGQMAASITHEIRNPMAVIRGFVQLMRERSPDHQQEYFRIIMEELDRANSIINDFLSLAQNRIVEKEVCSLHDIISDLEPLLWADANLRGQSVELDYCEAMPLLELNRKELKQLILNLTRNGMEAMGDKGVLKISTLCLDNLIQLRVTDSGTGISKDEQERLFEPFYTTKTRGTGLGLPLCLSIAERHKGIIEVHSIEGKGTTFIVSFAKTNE